MIQKITVICETFNNNRWLPHSTISDEIAFVKINQLKKKPYLVFTLLFKIIKSYFDKSFVIVAPFMLSPLVVFYYPLKFFKHGRFLIETSHPDWEEDMYPVELGIFKPILKKLWFSFMKGEKIKAINSKGYNFLKKISDNVALIPHSVDTDVFNRDVSIKKNDNFTVLFVGRLEKKKGLELIIKTAKERNNYEFWLVGKGPYSKLIDELNLPNIKLFGFIKDRHKLNRIYNKATCFVLPSFRISNGWEELFGMVLIEAMASKLPVISSDCIGPKDIINHKHDGLLFEKENLDQFIKSLDLLRFDNELRRELINNAYIKVKEKYSLKVISDRLEKFINSKENF